MSIEQLLPWQREQWRQLWQRKADNRLPHAILFSGIEGVGKKQFAEHFANAVLCHAPQSSGESCGKCKSCCLMQAKSHPDFRLLEPEEGGQLIKIDQVRDVVQFVNETAMVGDYRVVIIHPATAMNVAAANSLLKTLEEPTANTLIILISDQSMRLLATIRSRCQQITFSKPSEEMALAWLKNNAVPEDQIHLLLQLANGGPLKAKMLLDQGFLEVRNKLYQGLCQLSKQASDPLQMAVSFSEKDKSQEFNIAVIFQLMLSWLSDLLKLSVSQGSIKLANDDYQEALANIKLLLKTESLLNYLDHVQQSYSRMVSSFNLNRQLVLEELFIRWATLCS